MPRFQRPCNQPGGWLGKRVEAGDVKITGDYIQAASQRYTYRVLETIQMKFIILCDWAEPTGLGSTKTKIQIINLNRLTHIQFNI